MSELGDFFAATAVPSLQAGLGDAVAHWPRGVEADVETVTAIVDRSEEAPEGSVLEGANGRKILHRIRLSVEKSVAVTTTEKPLHASVFVIDGEKWFAEKKIAEQPGDGGLRTFNLIRHDLVSTRQS